MSNFLLSKKKKSLFFWLDIGIGFGLALLVLTPVLRSFLNVPSTLYFIEILLITILASFNLWHAKLVSQQLSWLLLLTGMATLMIISTLMNQNIQFFDSSAIYFFSLLTMSAAASVCGKQSYVGITFLVCFLGGGTLTSLAVIQGYVLGAGNFIEFYDVENYLTIGLVCALVSTLSFPLFVRTKGWTKYCTGMIFGIGLLSTVMGQSRGGLIFSSFSLLLASLVYIQQASKSFVKRFAYFCMTVSFVVVLANKLKAYLPERLMLRLLRLVSSNELESGGRGNLWEFWLSEYWNHPFLGHGLGYSVSAGPGHPHNHLLQIAIDGGILSAIVMLIIFIVPFKSCFHYLFRSTPAFRAKQIVLESFLCGYCFLMLEFSKSGNIYKAISLFIIAGLIIGQSTSIFLPKDYNHAEKNGH